MIKKCIQQWGKHEHDYVLSTVERILLTAKAVIAILLHIEPKDGDKIDTYDSRYVTIAIIAGGNYACEWGTCYWWESLKISTKWHEWRYIVDYDGSP